MDRSKRWPPIVGESGHDSPDPLRRRCGPGERTPCSRGIIGYRHPTGENDQRARDGSSGEHVAGSRPKDQPCLHRLFQVEGIHQGPYVQGRGSALVWWNKGMRYEVWRRQRRTTAPHPDERNGQLICASARRLRHPRLTDGAEFIEAIEAGALRTRGDPQDLARAHLRRHARGALGPHAGGRDKHAVSGFKLTHYP